MPYWDTHRVHTYRKLETSKSKISLYQFLEVKLNPWRAKFGHTPEEMNYQTENQGSSITPLCFPSSKWSIACWWYQAALLGTATAAVSNEAWVICIWLVSEEFVRELVKRGVSATAFFPVTLISHLFYFSLALFPITVPHYSPPPLHANLRNTMMTLASPGQHPRRANIYGGGKNYQQGKGSDDGKGGFAWTLIPIPHTIARALLTGSDFEPAVYNTSSPKRTHKSKLSSLSGYGYPSTYAGTADRRFSPESRSLSALLSPPVSVAEDFKFDHKSVVNIINLYSDALDKHERGRKTPAVESDMKNATALLKTVEAHRDVLDEDTCQVLDIFLHKLRNGNL
ncbi:hypothetical protein DFP72DRAFT_842963 [Ephemerocybe angulata]|uniref:Uncharacterized protein n=1 Tax=Ephemerocybe angulata TaxID=980116 RepID=A0A8H6I9K9_9AGAR|nr:hypothetical protein DFP72DRAFT_842963 [Tulosesus angulatus]